MEPGTTPPGAAGNNELILKRTGDGPVKVERNEALAEIGISGDAVLVKLEVGAVLEGTFDQIEHIANANSPMLHGHFEDDIKFKLWADGWLTNAFNRNPKLFGMLVRLKRLDDREYTNGVGKCYILSDLRRVRELAAKDAGGGPR